MDRLNRVYFDWLIVHFYCVNKINKPPFILLMAVYKVEGICKYLQKLRYNSMSGQMLMMYFETSGKYTYNTRFEDEVDV